MLVVEVAEDLYTDVLSLGLLVIHDAEGSEEDDLDKLSDILLSLDHERHVPEESVVLEEVCEVREVTGTPPGVLEGGQAEEVPKPSHFNNIYYYNNHYLVRVLT